jgi:hypothetical protein
LLLFNVLMMDAPSLLAHVLIPYISIETKFGPMPEALLGTLLGLSAPDARQ